MENGLAQIWKDVSANIQVLMLAGVCGVTVKTVLNPAQSWKQRIAQGVAGAGTAIFIGPLVAEDSLNSWIERSMHGSPQDSYADMEEKA